MVERNGNGTLTADQRRKLRGIVMEAERTEDQIDGLKLDLKGIYEGATQAGFDTKAIKALIARRKKTPEARQQLEMFQDLVATYELALAPEAKQPKSLMIDRPFAPPLDA